MATGLDDAARNALASGHSDLVPTLGHLVDELNAAKRAGADVARVDVDPGDGHPVRITIDPNKNAVDDELCYTISDYGLVYD
jgi:hypothetical protein